MSTLLVSQFKNTIETNAHVPFGTWFILIVLLALIGWLAFSMRKPSVKRDKNQILALIVAVALLFPVNYLGVNATIYALDIGIFFNTPYFFIGFLHIPLILFVLGYTGLLPGLIAGLITGGLQVFIHKQDPGLVLIYAAIPVLFAKLINEPRIKRPTWLSYKAWLPVLFTWIGLFPLILMLMGTRALFLRIAFEWALLRYCAFVWFSLLPAFIIFAALYVILQKYFVHLWRLPEFIKRQSTHQDYRPIVEQIRQLSMGNYDQEINPVPGQPRERQLYKALEFLRKSLLHRHETQSRLLSLDPSYFNKEDYDLILSSVLTAALTRDASSARLILRDGDDGANSIKLRYGQGDKTHLYAYLDGLILDKIDHQDQLLLTDIKVNHFFDLSSDLPFPQSIIALAIKESGQSFGILWIGFEQKKWFSEDDINFYKELAHRTSAAISTKQETQQLMRDKLTYEAGLNAFPHPVFIINSENEVLFMNQCASHPENEGNRIWTKDEKGKHISHPKLLSILSDNPEQYIHDRAFQLGNNSTFDLEIYPLVVDENRVGCVLLFINQAWLSQINQQRTEFISNISHDLLAPIKMIKGHLKLLENMGNLNKEQQTYVKLIDTYTESMSGLVNRLLNIEKLDGIETISYSRFDFQQKTEEVIRLLMPSAQQKKIIITQDYSKMATPFISADMRLIQQAMYNLLDNAIRYSPMKGSIHIVAEKDASLLHILVQDEGNGIAPVDQPYLFDRFFHLNEDENFENSVQGLGLAIVKTIAEKHGGTVRVESQLGEGSKFYLEIPIHKLS